MVNQRGTELVAFSFTTNPPNSVEYYLVPSTVPGEQFIVTEEAPDRENVFRIPNLGFRNRTSSFPGSNSFTMAGEIEREEVELSFSS